MKKTSFFFILILAVFFIIKTPAFAYSLTPETPIVTNDGTYYHWSGFSGTDFSVIDGAMTMKFCRGTDYGTCATPIWSGGLMGDTLYTFTTSFFGYGTGTGLPFDVSAMPMLNSSNVDGNYYLEIWRSYPGGTFLGYYIGDSQYYKFTRTTISGVATWNGISSVSSGIISQTTPASGSSVGFNVNFSGVYANSATYDHICANFTTTDASVAPYCAYIPPINGASLPYNFNYILTPNHSYTYTLKLYDSGNNLYTTATAPITFSTTALATTATPAYVPEVCSWADISTYGGCLDNVFYALFFPSSDSLTQFQGLYTQYISKPPFGYILAIQTALKGVNDTNTSVFLLQSMPVLNTYIFNPLRTALAWILWLGFAFLLFKRFQDIQL
jgi:hypothetical protein